MEVATYRDLSRQVTVESRAAHFLTVKARHPAEEGHQTIARGGGAGDVDRRSEIVFPCADVKGR